MKTKLPSIKYKFYNYETKKYHQRTLYLDNLPTNEYHTVLHNVVEHLIHSDLIQNDVYQYRLINYEIHDGKYWWANNGTQTIFRVMSKICGRGRYKG